MALGKQLDYKQRLQHFEYYQEVIDAGSEGLCYVKLYIANIPNVLSTAFTDVKLVTELL